MTELETLRKAREQAAYDYDKRLFSEVLPHLSHADAVGYLSHIADADEDYIRALEQALRQQAADPAAAVEDAVAEQSRIIGERWSAHDEEVKRVLEVNGVAPAIIYDAYHNAHIVMQSVMRRQNSEYLAKHPAAREQGAGEQEG